MEVTGRLVVTALSGIKCSSRITAPSCTLIGERDSEWLTDVQAGDHCACNLKLMIQFKHYRIKLPTAGEFGFELLTIW